MTVQNPAGGRKRLRIVFGARSSQKTTDHLLKLVRRLALAKQGDGPQRFVSLREASNRFHVPLSAMTGVFRRLESEGLLISIRGSRTILQGSSAHHEVIVRGVAGVPISLSTFLAIREYRSAFLQTLNELHSRGFV